jgi:rSAM/selenodomain-associated transferase 1
VILETVAVVVMSKFPVPGRVKTRLMPALSADEAARIHRVFLLHLLKRLASMHPAELVVCFDPPDSAPAMRDLTSGIGGVTLMPQAPGDLGDRLAHAAVEVGTLHRRVMMLGVDSPDMPGDHLARAAKRMHEHAVVTGPTDGGGFWCLGLWNRVDPAALLNAIAWSSGVEARQIAERAEALGYAHAEADCWDDVDQPADVARLLSRLSQSTDLWDRALLHELSFLPQGVRS